MLNAKEIIAINNSPIVKELVRKMYEYMQTEFSVLIGTIFRSDNKEDIQIEHEKNLECLKVCREFFEPHGYTVTMTVETSNICERYSINVKAKDLTNG